MPKLNRTVGGPLDVDLVNVLNVGVLPADLEALLFGPFALEQRLDVVLHGKVHELVLRLGLDHAGPLGPDHLDRPLDVDFAVETWCGVWGGRRWKERRY